jgi:hypothetical protein
LRRSPKVGKVSKVGKKLQGKSKSWENPKARLCVALAVAQRRCKGSFSTNGLTSWVIKFNVKEKVLAAESIILKNELDMPKMRTGTKSAQPNALLRQNKHRQFV